MPMAGRTIEISQVAIEVDRASLSRVIRAKDVRERLGCSEATAYRHLKELKDKIRRLMKRERVQVTLQAFLEYEGIPYKVIPS